MQKGLLRWGWETQAVNETGRDRSRFRLTTRFFWANRDRPAKSHARVALLCLAGLLLSACGSSYRQGEPAPVVSPGGALSEAAAAPASTRQGEQSESVELSGYREPPSLALARPAPANRAVRNLMQRAEAQRKAGEYAAAQASIERALRIEPENPDLWNRLAHLYLLQQSFARAEQFASKSNSLLQGDDGLAADNWSVIAQARRAQGDAAGAREASERARLRR